MIDSQTGKYLMLIGGAILVIGAVIYFFGANFRWIGHLPGDIRVEREHFRFYFPITTLLVFNLVIYLLVRLYHQLIK